jgi:transcriptional regulator with XRE-family HTH domain
MVERILELLKEKRLTPSQFADEIGIQRSGMSHLISGRNKPSLEFVMKVLKRFPDVSPEWVLYGTPEAVSPNKTESEHEINQEAPSREPVTLFDEQNLGEIKKAATLQRMVRKEKSGRRIEKIVIFYDDRTFSEYEPDK